VTVSPKWPSRLIGKTPVIVIGSSVTPTWPGDHESNLKVKHVRDVPRSTTSKLIGSSCVVVPA
jgi:hypothetical protein